MMQTLKYGSFTYNVDHAVKGADYIHGYDSAGNLIVSLEGISDFEDYEYTGTYMTPEECLEESCNDVKYVNGKFVRRDGTDVSPNVFDEEGNMQVPKDLSVGGKLTLAPNSDLAVPKDLRVGGELLLPEGQPLNVPDNLDLGGALILSPENYGDTLPATGKVGQLFFLKM